MFIVYSKINGDIKNIATGGMYNSLEDLFPYDYNDYGLIYDYGNFDDDLLVINTPGLFKVEKGKIILKSDELDKYKR